MSHLEQRIAMLEARFEISELRSKYCWYTARGGREQVVELFTEDGIFQNYRSEQGEPVTAAGRDALRRYFQRMQPGRRIPLVMNEVVHVRETSAEGTCAMQSIGDDGFCGHYIDTFQRIDGRWLFSSRRFFPYWPVFRPDSDRSAP